MGKALYRKYRSKSLDEIVGQQHITVALHAAVKAGSVSHAYLFTGPKGVGKTSIARILAHEVNGLEYSEEDTHLDIIEIDAASNRGIEDVRELRDKVHVAPANSKYKVYIIDEIHMLTTPAFNALLKTLEEPPAHVIFILATTEMHKLPETIVSRTQHFAFKPVPQAEVVKHLRFIATSENIDISDDALALIADYGGGSFRDSIGLLDQIRNYDASISADTVRLVTGVAPDEAIRNIASAVAEHRPTDVVQQLENLKDQGIEAVTIAKQLNRLLEQDILAKKPLFDPHISLDLMRALIEIPGSIHPPTALQVCLLQLAFEPTIAAYVAQPTIETSNHSSQIRKQPRSAAQPVVATEAAKPKPPRSRTQTDAGTNPPTIEKPPIRSGRTDAELSAEDWSAVMLHIKQTYNTLYGVLRMAETVMSPGKVTLKLRFVFHQKRLNEPKNKEIIVRAIELTTGNSVALECVVDAQAKPNTAPAKAQITQPRADSQALDPSLNTISNIFGGAELLES